MIKQCSVHDPQPEINMWPLNLSVGLGGFYGSVEYYFGYNQLRRSILSNPEEETKFRFLVGNAGPIKCAIETGTYKGTATALLAHYADKVVTIDKHNYIDKYNFWMEYDVYRKIDSYMIENEKDKSDLISKIDFDFAFLDGDHSLKGVRSDFDLVKKCGRVLFHDYYEQNSSFDKGSAHSQGIVPLIHSLPRSEVTISRPFAFWRKDGI